MKATRVKDENVSVMMTHIELVKLIIALVQAAEATQSSGLQIAWHRMISELSLAQ